MTRSEHQRGPRWWPLNSGVPEDVRNRLPWYKHDWKEGRNSGFRILAPAVYIAFASILPALAFGEQLVQETDGILSAVHTLTATALAGVIQAVIGGQPLLIVGVAEPIVLIYKYMYDFAEGKDDLGRELFLPWAGWACVWGATMILVLAAVGACRYIKLFTRFSGELFGALIAVLFFQEAVRGLQREFNVPTGQGAPTGEALLPEWRLVNGLWGLFLAFGLVLTSLLSRQARSWRFGTGWTRSLLADYGVPLMVIFWSGLGYAVAKPSPGGIPRRVQMPNTWTVKGTWTIAGDMGRVPGVYIAGALIPGLILTILFYFDHSVSSQLAQAEEFNLKKPSAYNYDFALLGIITAAFGLIGLPPINGVLPQAPMHTKSLATLKRQIVRTGLRKAAKKNEGGGRGAQVEAMMQKGRDLDSLAVGNLQAMPDASIEAQMENGNSPAAAQPEPSSSGAGDGDVPMTKPGDSFDVERELDQLLPVEVKEQRLSGLIQSLLCGACLGISPGIKLIPSSVVYGYFAYMAVDSLPGSQFWDRILLLFTDPRKRYVLLERGHAPYIETVPMCVITAFTLLQLVGLGAVYGITWAGIAGVIFPVFIMALVPFRQYIMPRFFKRAHLRELDAAPYEEAPPISPEEAHREAQEAGWEPPPEGDGSSGGTVTELQELGPGDWDGRRLRRPLDRASIESRRRISMGVAESGRGSCRRLAKQLSDGGSGSGGGSFSSQPPQVDPNVRQQMTQQIEQQAPPQDGQQQQQQQKVPENKMGSVDA